jgi:hypothetical protein
MTMKQDLMKRLLKGWCTPLEALIDCECMSLAQRVSEWRAERTWYFSWDKRLPPLIIDKWVDLPNGKRVKAYRAIPK